MEHNEPTSQPAIFVYRNGCQQKHFAAAKFLLCSFATGKQTFLFKFKKKKGNNRRGLLKPRVLVYFIIKYNTILNTPVSNVPKRFFNTFLTTRKVEILLMVLTTFFISSYLAQGALWHITM